MEPVRTPSQALVIFIFLMITIFNFNTEEEHEQPSSTYAELYHTPETWALGADNIPSIHQQRGLQNMAPHPADTNTLFHLVNYQEVKKQRNKLTNFVRSAVWTMR